MTRRAAIAAPALLLVLAAGFTVMAAQYGAASRAVPQLIGGAMLLLCLADIVSRTDTGFGRRLAKWLNPAGLNEVGAPPERALRQRQWAAMAGIACFILALILAGVLPAVAAFGLLAFRLGADQSWIRSVLIAGAMTAVVWLLFTLLLGLALFPGLLFGGGW